jgi:DNA polymerase V
MLRIKKQANKRDVLGFRLPMLTHEEPALDITDITVIDPDNTYFMRMGSEAMTGYQIGQDHILVIDRSLKPVPGSIVVFFHNGEFYTREYCPEKNKLVLKANSPDESLTLEEHDGWTCWGVVTLTLNPVLHPQQRIGRYCRVCAC